MSQQLIRRVSHCALAILLVLPASAAAQGETGGISGTVRDGQGLPLPGVTVEASSPALIERTRAVVTDADGRYQLINLRPGTYAVKFELLGFNRVQREGVELTAAFTATVNADMQVGGIEELITVSGTSPTVDTKGVVQQRTVTRDVIDALPTSKNFVALAALVPGVTPSRPDVGGSAGDLGGSLSVHGSRTGDHQIMMDGMFVGNGYGSGSYGHFFNNGIYQEVTFETGGMSAENDVAGVRSNLIPREGGNTFKGVFFGAYTNSHFNSSNVPDELTAGGVQTNSVGNIWDVNPSAGGYIVRDKLWFWLSFREWGTRTTRAGTSAAFPNADPSALFYAPDTSRRAFDHTWHRSASKRLTWQASPRHKIATLYDYQNHEYEFATDSVGSAPEARSFYREVPQYLIQATWNSPVSSRLLLEAGGTLAANDFYRIPQPEVVPGIVPITELSTNFSYRGNPTAPYGHNRSSNYNYRGSMSYVTGSHNFKSGVMFQHTWAWTTTEPLNPVSYSFRNGIPASLTQYATPIVYREKVKYNIGVYAQDRWTVGKATVNLGVRGDFFNAYSEPQSLEAGPFVPAREFPGVYDVPNWKDVSPRLGLAYDLFGDGRTAVKGNLGGFPIASGIQRFTRVVNPMASSVNNVNRTWNDLLYPEGDPRRGNFAPDCDLIDRFANGECGQMQNLNFGLNVPTTRYADDVAEGFGVRAYNWEGSVGIQHELMQGVSINASYSRRWYTNFQVTQNVLVSNADFSPYCVIVPLDPRLPGGGGNELCGFYDISPTMLGRSDNVISQADRFGKQTEVFDGFDFTATARLRRGVSLSGGVVMGRSRTNNCELVGDLSLAIEGSAANVQMPRTEAFCDVRPPMQANVKFLGVYPLPVWGLQTSATFQSMPGPEITASWSAPNAAIAPSLGRNLAAGQNATVLLDLVPKGTLYSDRINQLDLRLTKIFQLGTMRVQGMFDVYNALNASPSISVQTRFGPAWQQPTQVLIGRLAKFGVQIDF